MDFSYQIVISIESLQFSFEKKFDSLITIVQDMNTMVKSVTGENVSMKSEIEKLKTDLATITAELALFKMVVTIPNEMDNDKVQGLFIDLSLRRFAERLKCNEEICVKGRRLVDQVGELVGRKIAEKKPKTFTLGERRVAGRVGKNTDVISPDFDIVFAVNGQIPPFKEVIDALHDILFLHKKELEIQSGSLTKNGAFSLKFAFLNGIEVDLVPACNLPEEEIRIKMLANKEESWRYNSSLVKPTVDFMKVQDSFTHSVARLGKFWFKSCHFGEKVSGRSIMIELISVAAAMKELQMPVKSELRALIQVVEMVQNIDKIKIAFKKNSSGKWELIPIEILNKGNVCFGEWGICNDHILKRNYYLIEPTNPLNDLLQDKSPGLIAKMKKYAEVTKQRLDALIKDKYTNLDNAGEKFVEFEKIFEPQPSNLREVFRGEFPYRVNLCIAPCYNSIYPDVAIRNTTLLERAEVRNLVDALKHNMIWTVTASQRWSPGATASPTASSPQGQFLVDTIYSSVKKLIETNLKVQCLSPAGIKWDVDITVPFRTQGDIKGVCLFMNWN